MQFIKVDCTVTARSAIKCSLNKEQLSAKWQRDLKAKKRKYHDGPVKKRQALKKRYEDKKESIKQYKKEKCVENRTSNIIRKQFVIKILRCSWYINNVDTMKIQRIHPRYQLPGNSRK